MVAVRGRIWGSKSDGGHVIGSGIGTFFVICNISLNIGRNQTKLGLVRCGEGTESGGIDGFGNCRVWGVAFANIIGVSNIVGRHLGQSC